MRFLVFAVLATACAADSDSVSGCTATLYGAVAASNVTCSASASTDYPNGRASIVLSFDNPTGYIGAAEVDTTGILAVRLYTNNDAAADGSCEVDEIGGGPTYWYARVGHGSYRFDITSLGDKVQNPDGGAGQVFLDLHGTLDCTMLDANALSTVRLHATF
jgi:hypothetical protein